MKYNSRNLERIADLAPNTRMAAMKVYQFALDNNIDILITETHRTLERQQMLVREGRSKTLRSFHIVGQAFDFVPVVHGVIDYAAYDRADIKKFVSFCKKTGFEWGGDWKTFIDKPHMQYEYKGYGTDKVLEAAAKPSVKKPVAPAHKFAGVVLKNGSEGKQVKEVQTALKITADGKFGDKTEAAVKAFQKKAKIAVDGKVGQITFNKLFKIK